MPIIPLTIATFCYIWASWSFLNKSDYPMSLAYASYAVANIAFMWYSIRN